MPSPFGIQMKDVLGIIAIAIILVLAGVAQNPKEGLPMLNKMVDGIKELFRWINRQ